MTLTDAEGQKEGCSRTTWRRLHHQVGLCRHLFEPGGQMPKAEPEFIESGAMVKHHPTGLTICRLLRLVVRSVKC